MKINNDFEYFLNAILYCIWIREIKISQVMETCVNKVANFILTYFFSKKIKQKCYKNKMQGKKDADRLISFMDIEAAKTWLVNSYLSYTIVVSASVSALFINRFQHLNKGFIIIIALIPVIICYPILDRAVIKNDNYLNYFKQFKKEDEQWLKKWKRRTLMFQLGSVVATIVGILSMFIICGVITF